MNELRLLLLAAAVLSACGCAGHHVSDPHTFRSGFEVSGTDHVPTTSFARGAPVVVHPYIINQTGEDRTIPTAILRGCRLIVTDPMGNRIYAKDDYLYTADMTTIHAGERLDLGDRIWNQVDQQGNPIPSGGMYQIIADTYADDDVDAMITIGIAN